MCFVGKEGVNNIKKFLNLLNYNYGVLGIFQHTQAIFSMKLLKYPLFPPKILSFVRKKLLEP